MSNFCHCNHCHSSISRTNSYLWCLDSSRMICLKSFCRSASMNYRVDSPFLLEVELCIQMPISPWDTFVHKNTKLNDDKRTIDVSKINNFFVIYSLAFSVSLFQCNYRYYNFFFYVRGCHVITFYPHLFAFTLIRFFFSVFVWSLVSISLMF